MHQLHKSELIDCRICGTVESCIRWPHPFGRPPARHRSCGWRRIRCGGGCCASSSASDRAVRELMALIDEPQSLVSYHLRLLREGGLVTARRSSADGRDSYYAIDLAACREALQIAGVALHPALLTRSARAPVRPPARALVANTGCCSCARATAHAPRSQKRCSSGCRPATIERRAPAATRSRCIPTPSACCTGTGSTSAHEPHQAPRRVPRPAIRHGDHAVRPGARGLPGVPVPPRTRPLERSRPGARGFDRPRVVPGVRAHRGRARDPHQLPAPSVRPTTATTRRSAMSNDEIVSVRYMVDDVEKSVAFYTELLGFEVLTNFAPAFADVKRGNLRLLLAGTEELGGRPMPDGATPGPGGWNRIHLIVDDIDSRGRTAPRRRRDVPQRHRRRTRRQADPAAGPVRQRRRALPASRRLSDACL